MADSGIRFAPGSTLCECRDEVVKIADAINQFAMAIEAFAHANRGYPEKVGGTGDLFLSARLVRERIAEVLPE